MNLPFRLPQSIAFHLIAAVLAVELAASIVVILLSLAYEHHTHFRTFDVMLRGRADSVLGAVQDADDPGDNIMLNQADMALPAADIWEVFDDRDRLLGRSANWPAKPPTDPKDLLALSPTEFAVLPDGDTRNLRIDHRHYRFLLRHGTRIIDPATPGGGKLRHVTILYGTPTGRVWSAIREAVKFYAAGSLLLLLVTGPLIAWLLHRGLRPLRQLAAIASGITADDWHFVPPLLARQTPELAPLTLALESALERLHRAFDQQSAFVSDAAHEFKTAVAVVKSSLQLLTLAPRSAAEYRTGLDRVLSDVERLEQLIARSLTLARIERGAATPEDPTPATDLAQALRSTASELSTVADIRQVKIRIDFPEAAVFPVPLTAEDAHLLVSNLLLNALEHSPHGSAVELRLKNEEGMIEFEIEDFGEGIPPEALPHIFDRFYRGDPSRTRSTGGAGLGLSIVKALVTRAGGAISIVSQPACGTTVTVRLPQATKIRTPEGAGTFRSPKSSKGEIRGL